MVLLSSALAACVAFAPAPGGAKAGSREGAVDLGPFRIEHRAEITWPGLYVPDFEVSAHGDAQLRALELRLQLAAVDRIVLVVRVLDLDGELSAYVLDEGSELRAFTLLDQLPTGFEALIASSRAGLLWNGTR